MTRRHLAIACWVAMMLPAAGSVAAAAVAPSDSGASHVQLFGGGALLPGQTAQDTITVRGASAAPVRPYWQLTDVEQRCDGSTCPPGRPALAAMLQVTASDGSGSTWTGSLADLEHRVALPGGMLSATTDRRYHVTLTLPAAAGNAYSGLSVSAAFSWGGTDAGGVSITAPGNATIGTGVLGERIGRDPGASPSRQGDSLPFTGFDMLATVALGLALIGLGSSLVASGWRRRTSAKQLPISASRE